ncbi:MAG: hypothetical protein IJ868_07900 [Prevotella sp.]|nr:hypothetical protein [Prevotella sp.]
MNYPLLSEYIEAIKAAEDNFEVSAKIAASEWGDGVVKQLAEYIEKNSPEVKGFSDKNLWRMKQFYELYSGADEKLSALLRQISWTNNLTIMSRSKSVEERLFYLHLCVHDRLSTRQLNRQIDSALYERNAISTPKLSSVLREIAPQAETIFRDQYVMEFLGGKEYEHENTMKKALIDQMKKFVLDVTHYGSRVSTMSARQGPIAKEVA